MPLGYCSGKEAVFVVDEKICWNNLTVCSDNNQRYNCH